jgi:hypothetical protein
VAYARNAVGKHQAAGRSRRTAPGAAGLKGGVTMAKNKKKDKKDKKSKKKDKKK